MHHAKRQDTRARPATPEAGMLPNRIWVIPFARRFRFVFMKAIIGRGRLTTGSRLRQCAYEANVSAKKYFVLSICANVALAGAACHWFRQPAARASASATRPDVVAVRTSWSLAADSPAPVTCVTNRFHWRMIESEHYEKYAANLSAIGCPETTIRDIILADVERLYAAQRRDLGVKGPFWLGGSQRRKAERTQERKLDALKQEQAALIQCLLGIEWFPDRGHTFDKFEEQALMRFMLGPMPDESLRRVVHLLGKYEALQREVEHRCDGIRLEEDNAQLGNLYRQMLRDLASALTPSQMEEMMARGAAFEILNHAKFNGADITAMELRQIALAKASAGVKLFDWPADETDGERKAREEQFKAAVKNILGEMRYADFERAQDGEFRRLFEISKDNGLPKETAVKVFDIRKLAMEEAGRVRQDTSLDEPARRQCLEEMQAAVQKEVSGALGAKAWGDYLNRGGAWVTNLNKL
jgi:hypothetical protein